MKNVIWTINLVIFFYGLVAHATPLALVYKGAGACGSCTTAAAQMAETAGYQVKFVGPEEQNQKTFYGAKVWIQPGGTSLDVARNMNGQLKNMIRNFLRNGGGYVGFCAGAFFSTEEIRDEGIAGLGIFPGRSWLWLGVTDQAHILEMTWNGVRRDIYWEGGPFMDLSQVDLAKQDVQVFATYNDGKIAAAKTKYGLGRVIVSGAHPEAPEDWRTSSQLTDRDGLDWELAVDMIKWAGRQVP